MKFHQAKQCRHFALLVIIVTSGFLSCDRPLHNHSKKTPRAAFETLQDAFREADWKLLRTVCTEDGLESIEYWAQLNSSSFATKDDYLIRCADYLENNEVTNIQNLSEEYVRYDFEFSTPTSSCILFRKTREGWKVERWSDEPEVVPLHLWEQLEDLE